MYIYIYTITLVWVDVILECAPPPPLYEILLVRNTCFVGIHVVY